MTDLKTATSAIFADDADVGGFRAGTDKSANIVMTCVPQLFANVNEIRSAIALEIHLLTSFNSFFISRVMSTLFLRTFLIE